MFAVVANATGSAALMKTRGPIAASPVAHYCRKHRAPESVPHPRSHALPPADGPRGGVDKVLELCRSLDRVLWKSFMSPKQEEKNDE